MRNKEDLASLSQKSNQGLDCGNLVTTLASDFGQFRHLYDVVDDGIHWEVGKS